MELTKEALDNVRFRTKGLWYDAQQVDTFLEELTAAVEQQELLRAEEDNEAAALRIQVEDQLEEISSLKAQLEKVRQTAEAAISAAEDAKAAQTREAEKAAKAREEAETAIARAAEIDLSGAREEREALLQDIKALRSLRDQFKSAMEQDLTDFTEKLRALDSGRML